MGNDGTRRRPLNIAADGDDIATASVVDHALRWSLWLARLLSLPTFTEMNAQLKSY